MVTGNPRITVVTPSYDQARFLERTLLSVLTQGYPNLEYIVIDGGSTDGSCEIIRKYESRLAYWVSEKDSGQSNAINKGFKHSSGDILCWVNSDDTLLPGALKFVAQYLQSQGRVDCVYGDTVCVDHLDREILRRHELVFDERIVTYAMNYIPQSSTFWRRAVYEKIGGLREDLSYTMDQEYWLRMARHDFSLSYVPVFLSCYRWHARSKGNINSRKIRTEQENLKLEYGWIHSPRVLHLLGYPLKTVYRLKRQAIKVFVHHRLEFVPAHVIRWYMKKLSRHFERGAVGNVEPK